MKAIVFTKYGPPEVLELKEVEKPTPKDNEILIRIYATPVGSGDIIVQNFKNISRREFLMPYIFWVAMKKMFGGKKPKEKIKILGSEFAGEIESVGKAVTLFKKGDQVFGYRPGKFGTYAEYLCMPEKGFVGIKPANMTYEEAAGVPYSALIALGILRKVNIQSGQKILINGASGGIGHFAVQFAKYYGAEVTGVGNPTSLEVMKSLGADKVIDYTKEDFTKSGETYDVIFDVVGKSSFSRSKRLLKQKGIYLLAKPRLSLYVRGLWTSMTSSKKIITGIAKYRIEDFIFLKELIEAGKLKSAIDRRYPLEQIAEAHSYVDKGQKTGNVVITVEHI